MAYPENNLPETGAGRCLCGAVRFEWTAKPIWAADCHCESCRRANSAAYASFFGVSDGHWRWTGAAPTLFESTPGVRRWFCPTCGSQMAYAADRFPGETHFFAPSMDNPEQFQPTFEVNVDERLSWVLTREGLPQHRGQSSD